MKSVLFAILTLTLALTACVSMRSMDSEQRLAVYNAHAGPPVSSFHYFGSINGWEALDRDTLAIWTRPKEAWLLQLSGPCPGLEYSQVIGLTDQFGQVQAGFDKVLVRDTGVVNIPCRISTIRPLDVAGIRQVELAARERQASEAH